MEYIINDDINYMILEELQAYIKNNINNLDNTQDIVILLSKLDNRIFKDIRKKKIKKLYN